MKKLITILAVAAAGLAGTATRAEARHGDVYLETSYVRDGGYRRPVVRVERYLVGHDRWGRPIFATREVVVRPRPVRRYVAPCPPPRPPVCYPRPYPRSGFTIQARFGH